MARSQAQNYWAKTPSIAIQKRAQLPKGAYYLSLDNELFQQQFNAKSSDKQKVITLLNELGVSETFAVQEIALLAPELAKRYPNIKAYRGVSTERAEVSVRITHTGLGISAWMRLPEADDFFIQPVRKEKTLHYAYFRRSDRQGGINCKTESHRPKEKHGLQTTTAAKTLEKRTADIRTFRLAVAATAEYTDIWGDDNPSNGTNQEDAFAAVANTINRVNEVYETDIQVHLELVSDASLIYTDTDTDPFSDEDGFIDEIQPALDSNLGNENYDVGHLFALGGGGLAGLGVVCSADFKGGAYSAHPFQNGFNPYENDYFDIDYVAHEIGHQFGAYHTYSHDVEGTGVNAEPGSGSTIMGYAGITGINDLQSHSDPYFHFHSIATINQFMQGDFLCHHHRF